MTTSATCPSCHRTFHVPDGFAGRGICPDCRVGIQITGEDRAGFDPPEDLYPRPRRRPRPSPLDHLPVWRRVAAGFLVQQAADALLIVGLAGFMVGSVALAEDPGDFQDEWGTGQRVTAGLGLLAMLVGFAVQAIGRLVSAWTPVRAPRGLGVVSAIGSGLGFLGLGLVSLALIGLEAEIQAGNPPNDLVFGLAGLSLLGWMFLFVGVETCHAFAIAGVGRVMRADGVRTLGRGLGVLVPVVGLLALFAAFGFGLWADANNPNNLNPAMNETEALIRLVWMTVASAVTGLYLMLDLILMHHARAAVSRVAADAEGVELADRRD